MRSNIFSMKALRLALLSMFVTSTIIGVNSCRDEFDEKEALELEHAFLLQLQQQRDDARRQALLDSVQAAQAAAQQAAADRRAEIELNAQLQAQRDALFMKGGIINYAVNVVDGNSTTFSGGTSNGRTSSEDMSGFAVTVFHQELGTVATATTDASGMAVFSDLRIGKVTVNVLKPGFTPANFVADITPSTEFVAPRESNTGSNTGNGSSPVYDPATYTRSAATIIPVFDIELGNVFTGVEAVPTAELNRYSTVSGKANLESDLTNFVRETAPEGTLISLSIDADDSDFINVINRAINNTYGNNEPGPNGNGVQDGAEGDGRIVQLSYSDATFTGVVNATGDYTVIVPAFPTERGLPFRTKYSSVAVDQRLYDVVGTEHNEGGTPGSNETVYGVVTKRAVFNPNYTPAAAPGGAPLPPGGAAGDPTSAIPTFDAIDVSVAAPYDANTQGTGASAKAYINDTDGGISKVVISNGGHGYYAAPYVWIKHPNDAFQNAGEGDIVDIIGSFDASNTNYNDDRARATATITNGVVTAINVDYAGQGYYREDANGVPQPIEVIFIQHGVQPTFSATISVGGGCIASGTTWSTNAAFTQAPRIISVAASTGAVPAGFSALLSTSAAGGVGTVTLTTADGSDFCGFSPSAEITITVGSGVTSMMKLRPTIALEGGSIGPLTIAEGDYVGLGIADDVITNDVAAGATTEEEVLNGQYTQAPIIKITGAGTGATAAATLNSNGKVEKVEVTNAGSGYDRANTTIEVQSSVQDANGNYTRSAFQAKFVPVGGASTLTANTTTPVNQGTFYTKAQFDAFNADNTANDLVKLDAIYNLGAGATSTVVAPITQSNTALTATPAGTPLNVFYSTKTATAPSTVATADTDKNDTDPVANVGIATPGVNFSFGGQGYSEDANITISAVDNDNTRLTQAQTSSTQPVPNDFNDQAQFDYSLAEGYVTGITFVNGAATIPETANPLAIALSPVTGTAAAPVSNTDPVVIATTTTPNNTQSVLGANVTITPGTAEVSSNATGTGISRMRPVFPNTGGRFAQTPELEISGPGTGFEYRMVMDFQYALSPTFNSFFDNAYQFALRDVFTTAAGLPGATMTAQGLNAGNIAASAVALRTFNVTFEDTQTTGGAGQPTTAARFTATITLANALSDVDGAATDDVVFTIVDQTFRAANDGGAGYNAVNINNIVLRIIDITNTQNAAVTTALADANVGPNLSVDDNNGTLNSAQNFGATFNATTAVEAVDKYILAGTITEIVADNGRVGEGYVGHPTNTFTITGGGALAQNVPTSAQIGAITADYATNGGLQLTGASGVSATVTASGDGFPYIKGLANKEFIRLRRRDTGAYIDRAQIASIDVARRIGYIAFRQVPAGVTVYQTFDATLTAGVPAGGATAYGAINTVAPGTLGFTGRAGQGGATTAASTAGKTVAAVDSDNNGTSDYWGFVGNGYATPNINLTITAQNFTGGAPNDAATAEVRSSGLQVGSVRVNTGVVHPIVAYRDAANPERSVTAPIPTFRYTFGQPAGTTTFGTATRAGNASGQATANYAFRAVSTTSSNYMLERVDITSGGANYSAAPYFRVVPQATTTIGGTATGVAAVAGGAVTGVTINSKGAYGTTLPWIVLNDYIKKLYLREEGTNNARLKLNGVGTVQSIIVDNGGTGYTAGTQPSLMVVPKGNDFVDKDADGIYDGANEHISANNAATVTINAGADLANLASASFTITPGEGYTQDPDIVVNTHLRNYIAIPRRDDNPVFVTTTAAGVRRAFTVENNSATNFQEQDFSLADANNDGIVDLTAAWNDQPNEGKQPIKLADLNNIHSATIDNNRFTTARTNEGVISKINIGSRGDGLVAGTYNLVFYGGGPNAGGAAGTATVSDDGQVSTVALTAGGASYDDNYLNPGANGVIDPGSTAGAPLGDDFVGVRVIFPMGAGAAAEAVASPFTVEKIEVVSAGQGYADEPISVRVVPVDAQINTPPAGSGWTKMEYFLQDPEAAAPGIVETTVSGVTFDTNGGLATVTIGNAGAGYNAAPRVVIENFRSLLEREARRAFADGNGDQQFGAAFDFDEYVTAKVAVEVDAATGAISKVDIINPGFGYIANPAIRVIGIGSGADLTAGGIDFVAGSTGQQTGVSDYFGSYFLGGTALPGINFADHRLGSVTITDGGSGYFGGNFPRTFQGFNATFGADGTKVYVPAGINLVNDVYYGTGQRNLSEDTDTGSGAGSMSAGDNQ